MRGIRIADRDARGVLSFDLRQLLDLLGDRVFQSDWLCFVEECTAVDQETTNLEHAYSDSALLTGREFSELAAHTLQVIDGVFQGFLPGESQPWIKLAAIDSSFWEIYARDPSDLTPFQTAFRNVDPIAQGAA